MGGGDKEKVEWVFTDYYYQHLINQMDRISKLMVYYGDYEKAYGELTDIFNTISNSIHKHDPTLYDEFIELDKEVHKAIYEFKMAGYIKNLPMRAKATRMTKTKYELISYINEFHRKLFAVMDEMGMMFRRTTVDNRKDVFKTG